MALEIGLCCKEIERLQNYICPTLFVCYPFEFP